MNTRKYGNFTVYGIQSSAERYSWAAYHLFVVLSSLIGDTLIFYASFQEGAFILNTFIATIIQHIALSDIGIALSNVLTSATSLLTNSWVLGEAACYAEVYTLYSIYPAGLLFVTAMTTSKHFLLKHPLRALNWTRARAHQTCIFIWVVCLLTVPVTFLALGEDDVQFDYRIYNCEYGFSEEAWKFITPIYSTIFQFIPSCIIIGTTVPTLKYIVDATKSARRVRGTVPWQGAMTVALTAAVFCISNMPLFVYFIGKDYVEEGPTSFFHIQYFRLATFLTKINVIANFYIYALTMRSFRRFLLSQIRSVVPSSVLDPRNEAIDAGGTGIVLGIFLNVFLIPQNF